MIFASTGDIRFRNRLNYIVTELDACQQANGNGYLAAIPNGKKIFREVAAGDIRVQPFDLNGGWVPWYTLHKLFAGLLDVDRYKRKTKALSIASSWLTGPIRRCQPDGRTVSAHARCEHGG